MNIKIIVTSGVVSLLVAIPLGFATLSVTAVTSWVDMLRHPGFWTFYLRSASWLFLAGFTSTIVTLLLLAQRKKRGVNSTNSAV